MNTPIATEPVRKINPSIVHVSIWNTRQPTAEDVAELILSIKELKQATPALARPHPDRPGEYELACGARRRLACELLKIDLDLIVRPMTDDELKDVIVADNLQHEDPSPESEAEMIRRRMKEGMTPTEIAAKYGKSDIWVLRRMKLLDIVPVLAAQLQPGESLAHYTTEMRERLGSLPVQLQEDIAAEGYDYEECKTMEDLRSVLETAAEPLKDCEWMEDPDTFIEGCGPGCATDTNKSVFPESGGKCGRCLNEDCFFQRRAIAIDKAITAALGGREVNDVVFFRSAGYSQVEYQGKTVSYLHEYEFKRRYSISKAKKGTDLIGIDVALPAAPVVVFLVVKSGKKAGGASGGGGEKESREDKLTARRLAVINPRVVKAILALDAKEMQPNTPYKLAAIFGMKQCRSSPPWSEAEVERVWKDREAHDSVHPVGLYGDDSPPVSVRQAIWMHVRTVLAARLTFRIGKDLLPEHRVQDMKAIAKIAKFDYQAEWEKICTEEVPVPKSWGKGFDPVTLEKAA